eukprot:Pgem_evm1s6187
MTSEEAFQGWYLAAIILPSLMWVLTIGYIVYYYKKCFINKTNQRNSFVKLTLFSLIYGSFATFTSWCSLPILAAGEWDYCKFFVIFTYGITDAFNPLSINLNVLLGLYRLTLVKNQFIADRKKRMYKIYCVFILVVTFGTVVFDLYGAFPESLEKIEYGCDWSLTYHIVHNSLVLLLDILNTIGSTVIIYECWKTMTFLSSNNISKSQGSEKLKRVLKYMMGNAIFSLFIYKPIIIVEYCRAWVHFGEWAFLDNVVTGYCTLAIMENNKTGASSSRTSRSGKQGSSATTNTASCNYTTAKVAAGQTARLVEDSIIDVNIQSVAIYDGASGGIDSNSTEIINVQLHDDII